MKKIGIALLLIAIMSTGVMIGCSNNESPEEAFCDSVSQLNQAYDNLDSITLQTTTDQVQQYEDQFQSAWENTANAAKDLAYDKWNDVEAAYNNLISSLDSIPGGTTLQEALPAIKTALSEFWTNLDEMESVECNSTNTQ